MSEGIFINADEILEDLQKSSLVVLDIRPLSVYSKAHIPNAIWINVLDFFENKEETGLKPKNPLEIAKILGNHGLSREDHVVIAYDKMSIGMAPYVYWYLEYVGQEEIYLLKGGMEEWIQKKLPIEEDIVKISPKGYDPVIKTDMRASLEEVVRAVREGEALLLDIRTYDEYVGNLQITPRPGRIPGSILVEPKVFIKAFEGDSKAIEEISRIAKKANGRKIITYCSTGERAALAWLVLKKILKIDNVKLYPESFYEYSSKNDLEIEIGPPR